MPNSEKLRRMGLDKAASLILLMLGLIIAKFVISSKTSFNLSGSIALKGTGLEVSMPSSENWKLLSNDFKYENNEFRISAIMRISSDSAISATWRYLLIPQKTDPNERFLQIAASLQGHIQYAGAEEFGQFIFDYARIESQKAFIFVGTAVLPNGRNLVLEVVGQGTAVELSEKLFKALLASAKYNADNSFVKGALFLDDFKNKFMPDVADADLSEQMISDYYRIKDTAGNTIGFTTDTLSYSDQSDNNLPLSSGNLLFYSPSSDTFAEHSLFRSDTKLTSFDWTISQGFMLTNRQQRTIIQLRADVLTIEKSGRFEQMPFTEIMIPDSLFDLVVASFLKSDFSTLYIESLQADGRISPVILSRIKSTETAALPERSAAQADFLGAVATSQKMYFDGRGRLVSADIQGNFTFRLERTTRAAILADFPQWLDKIQQLEQSQNKKNQRSR